jgi:hypothetical protein
MLKVKKVATRKGSFLSKVEIIADKSRNYCRTLFMESPVAIDYNGMPE